MRKEKKDSEDHFFNICLMEFQYLVDEFNFEVVSQKSSSYSCSIFYKNHSTAVEISYEPREKHIFVLLMRLVDGEIPEYPIFICQEAELNSFYLDDLLSIRNSPYVFDQKLIETPFKKSGMGLLLKQYAQALKIFGSDILGGDFEIFSELEKVVKKRAKNV